MINKMIEQIKCMRCGSTENLRRHHIKYNEIENEDEVIIECQSCHMKFHYRLRRENKWDVPVELWVKYE